VSRYSTPAPFDPASWFPDQSPTERALSDGMLTASSLKLKGRISKFQGRKMARTPGSASARGLTGRAAVRCFARCAKNGSRCPKISPIPRDASGKPVVRLSRTLKLLSPIATREIRPAISLAVLPE
jgi:hypothetical protein